MFGESNYFEHEIPLRGNSKWETVVKVVGFVKLAFVK